MTPQEHAGKRMLWLASALIVLPQVVLIFLHARATGSAGNVPPLVISAILCVSALAGSKGARAILAVLTAFSGIALLVVYYSSRSEPGIYILALYASVLIAAALILLLSRTIPVFQDHVRTANADLTPAFKIKDRDDS